LETGFAMTRTVSCYHLKPTEKRKYMSEIKFNSDAEALDSLKGRYATLQKEIRKAIVGQDEVVKNVLISIFGNGHCLLVGVPGLAKTLLVNTIGRSLGLSFNRIQFTPDLMPSDIIGSEILDENRQFKFLKGPIFSNIILADEINRTPPKTQSALLEAMQERKVTASGKTHELPSPFFVLATQNPIEQEGTYPLPEAQLDRFMLNVWLDYPVFQDEIQIVKNTTTNHIPEISPVISGQEIVFYQQLIRKMPVTDNVIEYAVRLVSKTRPDGDMAPEMVKNFLSWGAGPRASQYLIIGAKCHAALNGKYSPDIEDIKAIAIPILRHRIVRNYKAEAEGYTVEKIIGQLL
jgi:MoxR-like ATPase